MNESRSRIGAIAKPFLDRGDATGWFEEVYATAGGDRSQIPWADKRPNEHVLEWLAREKPDGRGKRALVVGCGLGDDAEEIERAGFAVTAFDIAPTAIAWCRRRFPQSSVQYAASDLFATPPEWNGAFDFVLESYTLQALPPEPRARAIGCIAPLLKTGGTLLVVTRGRDAQDPRGNLPWPLTKEELAQFQSLGLMEVSFEDYFDRETPPIRRFRIEYLRAKVPRL